MAIKTRATVEEVRRHSADVVTLGLVPDKPAPRFRAGQFLHLALDPYDAAGHWPDSRVFSIASPPESRNRLELTVSRQGVFTSRVLALEPGATVWLKLPFGDFVIDTQPGRETVLVAGGTGFTPFASFLASEWAPRLPLRVFYGARSPELLIYADVVRRAIQVNPLSRARLYAEQTSGSQPGDVVAGRLSVDDMVGHVDAPAIANWYLSGPAAMIRVFREQLLQRGVLPNLVHVDAWE